MTFDFVDEAYSGHCACRAFGLGLARPEELLLQRLRYRLLEVGIFH